MPTRRRRPNLSAPSKLSSGGEGHKKRTVRIERKKSEKKLLYSIELSRDHVEQFWFCFQLSSTGGGNWIFRPSPAANRDETTTCQLPKQSPLSFAQSQPSKRPAPTPPGQAINFNFIWGGAGIQTRNKLWSATCWGNFHVEAFPFPYTALTLTFTFGDEADRFSLWKVGSFSIF